MARYSALLISSVCLLFTLWGCHDGGLFSPITEVDPGKLPNRAVSRLVIGCFISPQDTVINVSVTETTPLYDSLKQNPVVRNARVILANAQNDSISFVYSERGYYHRATNKFLIVGGQRYTLTVTTPDGRRAVASCQVPAQAVPIQEIRIDSGFVRSVSIGTTSVDSTLERYAYIRWRDVPGTNYYRVYGVLDQTQIVPTVSESRIIPLSKLLYFSDESNRTMILSDQNASGQVLQSANGIYWRGSYIGKLIKQKVTLYLLNTDKVYYNYYRSIATYQQANDNPFAEPAPITSNVTGGLGCFAAYNGSKMIVILM